MVLWSDWLFLRFFDDDFVLSLTGWCVAFLVLPDSTSGKEAWVFNLLVTKGLVVFEMVLSGFDTFAWWIALVLHDSSIYDADSLWALCLLDAKDSTAFDMVFTTGVDSLCRLITPILPDSVLFDEDDWATCLLMPSCSAFLERVPTGVDTLGWWVAVVLSDSIFGEESCALSLLMLSGSATVETVANDVDTLALTDGIDRIDDIVSSTFLALA